MAKVPPPPITAFWRSSSASGGGECIQVTGTSEYVWLRDSKHPRGPIIGFTRERWLAFLDVVQRRVQLRERLPGGTQLISPGRAADNRNAGTSPVGCGRREQPPTPH